MAGNLGAGSAPASRDRLFPHECSAAHVCLPLLPCCRFFCPRMLCGCCCRSADGLVGRMDADTLHAGPWAVCVFVLFATLVWQPLLHKEVTAIERCSVNVKPPLSNHGSWLELAGEWWVQSGLPVNYTALQAGAVTLRLPSQVKRPTTTRSKHEDEALDSTNASAPPCAGFTAGTCEPMALQHALAPPPRPQTAAAACVAQLWQYPAVPCPLRPQCPAESGAAWGCSL